MQWDSWATWAASRPRFPRESPVLERDAVPEFISNWALTTDFAINLEFGGGERLVSQLINRLCKDKFKVSPEFRTKVFKMLLDEVEINDGLEHILFKKLLTQLIISI